MVAKKKLTTAFFREAGKRGAAKRVAQQTPKERKAIATKAAKARWAKAKEK